MVNKPPPQFLSALRKGITDGFSLNELRILCADLGVEYQDLSGDTKQIKALELVEYMNHRGRLGELLACIQGLMKSNCTLTTKSHRRRVHLIFAC